MKRYLNRIRNVALLPTLAFIFALFIGGIFIVLSDGELMAKIKSPGKFLTAAGAKLEILI